MRPRLAGPGSAPRARIACCAPISWAMRGARSAGGPPPRADRASPPVSAFQRVRGMPCAFGVVCGRFGAWVRSRLHGVLQAAVVQRPARPSLRARAIRHAHSRGCLSRFRQATTMRNSSTMAPMPRTLCDRHARAIQRSGCARRDAQRGVLARRQCWLLRAHLRMIKQFLFCKRLRPKTTKTQAGVRVGRFARGRSEEGRSSAQTTRNRWAWRAAGMHPP